MSKNYSSTEIEGATRKLVKGTVRRKYGTLGNRELSTEFDDLQDAAAGVFVTTAAAPFYVVFLGSRRMLDVVAAEASAAGDLLEAITATGRYAPPVKSVTALSNAQAALAALSGAAQERQDAFQDIKSVPAYKRYAENTSRFLQQAALSVRADGAIAQTPQEARGLLSKYLKSLELQHSDVLQRVQFLTLSISDYVALNLAGLLSAGVIENARSVLHDRVTQLESLSEEERNTIMRDVTLDVLAGRAAVEGFGSITTPTEFVVIEGQGSAFADATHPGLPAVLSSELMGPYTIVPTSSTLSFIVDSAAPLTVPVQASYVAELDGLIDEPYFIYGPSNPPPAGFARNDHFEVDLPGYPLYSCRIGQGNSRSIEGIVAELNAEITSQPIEFEAHHRVEKFEGEVQLVATGAFYSSGMDFRFTLPGQSWLNLGLQVSDTVIVHDSTSPNNFGYYSVGSITATDLRCLHVLGPAATDEADAYIEIGSPLRHVRLKIKDSEAAAAISARQAMTLPADTTDQAYQTLGFPPGATLRCQRTSALAVAKSINIAPSASTGTTPRMAATATFVPHRTMLGHSDPYDAFVLTLFVLRAEASYAGGGTSVVLSIVRALQGAVAAVAIGDQVVLRSAAASADMGLVGIVTAVGTTTITATFPSALTDDSSAVIDVAPPSFVQPDYTLRIAEGTLSAGDYLVQSVGDFAGDATLERALPFYQDLGGQPYFFSVAVGQFRVDFRSLEAGLTSAIEVQPGGCADAFFGTTPQGAVGQTAFVQLPSKPKGLEQFDQLEFYDAVYNVPDLVCDVVGLELSQQLITVDPVISMSRTSINFSLGSPPPFARIRNTQTNNFEVLREALEEWLELPENQPQFFRELGRSINPLIANANPTAGEVANARARAQQLVGVLTVAGATAAGRDPSTSLEAILQAYEASGVPRVDTLIDSFRQKGADRAIDLLLGGRFSEFFGLDQDTLSYLGDTLSRLRDVQRNDLPIRRTKRQDGPATTMIVTYEDADAEFDLSDATEAAEPDIPGMLPDGGPGSAY